MTLRGLERRMQDARRHAENSQWYADLQAEHCQTESDEYEAEGADATATDAWHAYQIATGGYAAAVHVVLTTC